MNQLFYFSDGDIQSQMATKYNLLVYAGKTTLRYAIVDIVKDQIKTLAEYEWSGQDQNEGIAAAISSLPESGKEFRYNFNKVKIAFDSFQYALIPEELYDNGDQAAYDKFTGLETGQSLVNTIKSTKIKNVGTIDGNFQDKMTALFGKPLFYNQVNPFLEITGKSQANATALFIHFEAGNFQIAVYSELKLVFYNIFQVSNADEFNYFLLQVLDETNIDTTKTEVIVSGAIVPGDEQDSRLSKYFDEVRLADLNLILPVPVDSNAAPYRFFSLMGLHLCE